MRSKLENRILAAAIRLFSSEGYDRARMKDIAAAARVPSAAVCRIFGTKTALFEEALRAAVLNVVDPHTFVPATKPDDACFGFPSALLNDSGVLVLKALTAHNREWRYMVLAAVRNLPVDLFREQDSCPETR